MTVYSNKMRIWMFAQCLSECCFQWRRRRIRWDTKKNALGTNPAKLNGERMIEKRNGGQASHNKTFDIKLNEIKDRRGREI